MFYEVLMEKSAAKKERKLDYDRDKLLRNRNTTLGAVAGNLAGAGASLYALKKHPPRGAVRQGILGVAGPIAGTLLGAGIGRYGAGTRGDRQKLDADVRHLIERGDKPFVSDLRKNYGYKG